MKGIKLYVVSLTVLVAFSIGWRTPRNFDASQLNVPVNMSLQDTLLLVSDKATGVHVYDVTDPAAPVAKFVIPLPGNRGTAVKDDIVYANDQQAFFAIRLEADTFTVVKQIDEWEPYPAPMPMDMVVDGGFGCSGCNESDPVAVPSSGGSVGSSFATFAVIDSFLYYFNGNDLVTMDISTPEDPVELSRNSMPWGVETLYPTDEFLFMGGNRGMYIYDRGDPAAPGLIGLVEHFRSCDPVVVSGDYAYVTLRGGNTCGQSRDAFLVVNIEDPADPVVVSETPVPTPYGLAIDHPMLYLSTGDNGFKLVNVAVPNTPAIVESWSGVPTKDFIWYGDILYVMSFSDVKIYDVSVVNSPVFLSSVE